MPDCCVLSIMKRLYDLQLQSYAVKELFMICSLCAIMLAPALKILFCGKGNHCNEKVQVLVVELWSVCDLHILVWGDFRTGHGAVIQQGLYTNRCWLKL